MSSHGFLRPLVGGALLCTLVACEAGLDRGSGDNPDEDYVEELGQPVPGRHWATSDVLEIVPAFTVHNDHTETRVETIRASVPFPQGMVTSLAGLGVEGRLTSWLILQTWPDGSVRIAQAQFTAAVAAGSENRYRVIRGQAPLQDPFAQHPWVGQPGVDYHVGARVLDTFGVPYEAWISGSLETLQETSLVRVRRHRGYHTNSQAGIGRDYLTSTFYLTEFSDIPVVIVDWILGNDYLGADNTNGSADPNLHPLGAIDAAGMFLVEDVAECRPYLAQLHGIGTPVDEGDGRLRFDAVPADFIDDGQTRRFRFVLRFDHPNASPAGRQQWMDTVVAMTTAPMIPLAELSSWQDSQALGLFGGPIDPPADAFNRAESEYQSWLSNSEFGTWGDFGDAKNTGTTGTPRNGPSSPELYHAVQGDHHRTLLVLEQKAWAQAMRTYHLYGLTVGDEQRILLWDGIPFWPGSRDLSHESLGRRALWASDPYAAYRTRVVSGHTGHGWGWFDHEHWTTDLLFDYWTVTGDEWAKEELRQLGQSLKGLMRIRDYSTSHVQAARAEGWTVQSFVQVYLATGDPNIRAYALRRIREVVDVERESSHPSKAISFQYTYPGTLFGGSSHRFFMPWQHGPVLYGYLAAYRFFGDPLCLTIAEDVIHCLNYSWVRNYSDPQFGFVERGLRYYTPVELNGVSIAANYFDYVGGVGVRWGDSPIGGAHTFLVGGLHLLADVTASDYIRGRALFLGGVLRANLDDPNRRWDKWWAAIPPRYGR